MNRLQEQQKEELEKIEICGDILKTVRTELYLSLRHMDTALSAFSFMPDSEIQGVGTDGFLFYFQPDFLIENYRSSRIRICRQYLHTVLHCLFGHLNRQGKERDPVYWNLACDITVESVIDSLALPALRIRPGAFRKEVYRRMKKDYEVLTPERVYSSLLKMHPQAQELSRMQEEFYQDDHNRWHEKLPPKKTMERQKRWEKIRENMQTEVEIFGKETAQDSKGIVNQMQVENRQKYDYKKFLRKFAVLKEEVQVDPDSFDYIFYTYGMKLYGNMPLLEPQETREVHKIEDFVIAIDTSMSCREELVRRFLEETYAILTEQGTYFRKVNIHILQCDEKIQSDVRIENREQLEHYMKQLKIKGRGGTDFRPVFGYINELLTQKAFHRLRGLLYFTDGYGKYPVKRPLYETAFIFMQDDYRDVDVPPWAMKLIITPEELINEY